MAKTKKQGENNACSALFECGYYSEKYGILCKDFQGTGQEMDCGQTVHSLLFGSSLRYQCQGFSNNEIILGK